MQNEMMMKTFEIVDFKYIIEKLCGYCKTEAARKMYSDLTPFMSPTKVMAKLSETSESRNIIETLGAPPAVLTDKIDGYVEMCGKGEFLTPEKFEQIAAYLASVKRLQSYLNRAVKNMFSLGAYADELDSAEELKDEIQRVIVNGAVSDGASVELRSFRRDIEILKARIKTKAEDILRHNKECFSEQYVTQKNGRICLPVKKEYKNRISGGVCDISASGLTIFIEPSQIADMSKDLEELIIAEQCEVIKILYSLSSLVSDYALVFSKNNNNINELDFIFAKGHLSIDLDCIEPRMNTERRISIKEGRHPLIDRGVCVPLNFELRSDINGMVITGPNTGGKTVAIKTVGLFSIMAQCGLHVSCKEADICMNNIVLCDVGDGQNIQDNLSTFSSHIINIKNILEIASDESLIIIDELGAGTDPTEGMGIAIAVIEYLKDLGCNFIITTHYSGVKEYVDSFDSEEKIINARMAFDRKTLRPLYRLELGKAGESNAIYIAKNLGLSDKIIRKAYKSAYDTDNIPYELLSKESKENTGIKPNINFTPRLEKEQKKIHEANPHAKSFSRGDSVFISPNDNIGIVYKESDEFGNLILQVKGESGNKKRITVNHKRLRILAKSEQLYPEDYDFSIIFDSVEVRKAHKSMSKRHDENLSVTVDED
ncbi:MAG: DNA mismatch repair protein MutS [Oscillospiraceae bacterium]|nr:DNA mismatch repair protein MutS [Oscillospiraceae bacterium]